MARAATECDLCTVASIGRSPLYDECASARCAGGNCCDVATLADGCVDCNYRGLCDECAAGYTLCDHTSEGR